MPCWHPLISMEPMICFELESTRCVPMIVIKRRAAVRWATSHPVLACQLVPPRRSTSLPFPEAENCLHGKTYRSREIKVPDSNSTLSIIYY